ncbi:MAG: hypothetical protein EXQ96_01450 [Alphaproteobacteria bacterium]|nr:hypothetical protein [Alphaproteobacteria bacterium]
MCTTVLLRRPGHAWPLLLAANRDERLTRPWRPPGRHWPDRDVVAGLDETAGGTWLGINGTGLVAAVMNRVGSLGPAPDKRSRGELVLEALDHTEAGAAATALADLDGSAYRSFNLVVADAVDAFWVRGTGDAEVSVRPIPPGLSMLTARELNDPACPRIRGYRSRFAAAPLPDPARADWGGWQSLLADRGGAGGDPLGVMCIVGEDYGTSSSSLIALPESPSTEVRPRWLFAPGRPDRAAFVPVDF